MVSWREEIYLKKHVNRGILIFLGNNSANVIHVEIIQLLDVPMSYSRSNALAYKKLNLFMCNHASSFTMFYVINFLKYYEPFKLQVLIVRQCS